MKTAPARRYRKALPSVLAPQGQQRRNLGTGPIPNSGQPATLKSESPPRAGNLGGQSLNLYQPKLHRGPVLRGILSTTRTNRCKRKSGDTATRPIPTQG